MLFCMFEVVYNVRTVTMQLCVMKYPAEGRMLYGKRPEKHVQHEVKRDDKTFVNDYSSLHRCTCKVCILG